MIFQIRIRVKVVLMSLLLSSSATAVALPSLSHQQPSTLANCYQSIIGIGASEKAKNRAALLCRNSISADPAQCYQSIIGIGASEKAKDRAALLCTHHQPYVYIPYQVKK